MTVKYTLLSDPDTPPPSSIISFIFLHDKIIKINKYFKKKQFSTRVHLLHSTPVSMLGC